MNILAISDTHCHHRDLVIPSGVDVLVHAGDITFDGNLKHLRDFDQWVGELKGKGLIKHCVVIAGNHDLTFQLGQTADGGVTEAESILLNCRYLKDSAVVIDGKKFYGSPWTPKYYDWAFQYDPLEVNRVRANFNQTEAERIWSRIPEDVDVLITHGPPFGILDEAPDGRRTGCVDLLKRVREIVPRIHIFGHIHHSYGTRQESERIGYTIFINACSVNEKYEPVNLPIAIGLG